MLRRKWKAEGLKRYLEVRRGKECEGLKGVGRNVGGYQVLISGLLIR